MEDLFWVINAMFIENEGSVDSTFLCCEFVLKIYDRRTRDISQE